MSKIRISCLLVEVETRMPLPTAVRQEWVIRAAEAGKHVLCEKPCGVTSDDVRAMLAACRQHGSDPRAARRFFLVALALRFALFDL